MAERIHVYRGLDQPATRFCDVELSHGRRCWFRYPGGRLLFATCCGRRRPAKNLRVRVYYDVIQAFCAPGKGCQRSVR